MYLTFSYGGKDFDILMSFGLFSVPMLTSSILVLKGYILGFLATSLESNKYSKGTNTFGKKIFFKLRISGSSCWK